MSDYNRERASERTSEREREMQLKARYKLAAEALTWGMTCCMRRARLEA
jgi:hypothetical protein